MIYKDKKTVPINKFLKEKIDYPIIIVLCISVQCIYNCAGTVPILPEFLLPLNNFIMLVEYKANTRSFLFKTICKKA